MASDSGADHSMGGTTGHDHGHHDGHMGGGMTMQMTFYASEYVTILFTGWKTTSVGGLIGSCIAIFALGVIYEAIKSFRESLYMRKANAANSASSESSLITSERGWLRSMIASSHLLQTLLYLLQMTLGYILMLIVMTFNVYVCLAVVLGATVGFWAFGWKKCPLVEMTSDHCG